MTAFDRRFCVAPMMDCTDRHDRFLLRQISRCAPLYTEMVTTGALIHGDRDRLLAHHPAESPLALQLGGSEPAAMAECARMAADRGYGEVNINAGCPSDRVRSGRFGAILMTEPSVVARCVEAMTAAVPVPITVKTRIGVDERDAYEDLQSFVEIVAGAGCGTFIIHARKAWLDGLSPRENREIPPLRYDVPRHLKQDFPALEIIINGGIRSVAEAADHLRHLDGVMVGRAAYRNPFLLAEVDRAIYGRDGPRPTREEVIGAFVPYVETQLAAGVPLPRMTRHLVGLFHGRPGARAWRRYLSENAGRTGAGVEVITAALTRLPPPAAPCSGVTPAPATGRASAAPPDPRS